MLETVREFGRLQLNEAGDEADQALQPPAAPGRPTYAQPATATALTDRQAVRGDRRDRGRGGQPRRRAARRARRGRMIAPRSSSCSPRSEQFWTVRGEHAWAHRPDRRRRSPRRSPTGRLPPELEDTALGRAVRRAHHARDAPPDGRRAQRTRSATCSRGSGLGPGATGERRLAGMIAMLLDHERVDDAAGSLARLERRWPRQPGPRRRARRPASGSAAMSAGERRRSGGRAGDRRSARPQQVSPESEDCQTATTTSSRTDARSGGARLHARRRPGRARARARHRPPCRYMRRLGADGRRGAVSRARCSCCARSRRRAPRRREGRAQPDRRA